MACSASIRTVDPLIFRRGVWDCRVVRWPQAHAAHREWAGMGLELRLPTAAWGLVPKTTLTPLGLCRVARGGLAAGNKDICETEVPFKFPKSPSH